MSPPTAKWSGWRCSWRCYCCGRGAYSGGADVRGQGDGEKRRRGEEMAGSPPPTVPPSPSRPAPPSLVVAAGVVGVAALVPQVTTRPDLLNLLFLIFLYVTLSQSWNILGGFAGQISLGHAVFFGVGALVTRSLWTGGTSFPAALLAGGVAALAVALVIGVPTFRLRGA